MNETSFNAIAATFADLAVRAATYADAHTALDDALTDAIADARAGTADAIATLAAINSAHAAYSAARSRNECKT